MPVSKKRTYAPKTKSMSKAKRPTYSSPVVGGVQRINKRPSLGTRTTVNFIYFTERRGISSTLNLISPFRFAISALFDLNISDVGHQPTNYDQLMALYEEYCVIEVEYRIQAFAITNGESQGHIVAVSDDQSSSADPRNYIENGQAQWNIVNGGAGSPGVSTFTGKVDIAKCHGITREALLGDTRYSGTVGASPTENIFLTCGNYAQSSSATVTSNFTVELRCKAVLYGSKLNGIS